MRISKSKSIAGLACAGVLGATMLFGAYSATPKAFAAPTAADAALSSDTQTYTTTDATGTGSWGTDNGKVQLTYDTTNGSWTDDTGTTHDNGTFIVRIPTSIKYEGMNTGTVNTSNDYDVTVEGVLAPAKTVTVKAETGNAVKGDNLLGSITETTTMKGTDTGNTAGAYGTSNFRTFTADQVSAMTGDQVTGKTVQDNIAMTGTALSAGTYTGTVQYTAALS